LFGVVWAWLILGEALTSSMAIAGVMILGSVAIAQRAVKT
jgi:drug/metabolite transporter (DMT)-like permease